MRGKAPFSCVVHQTMGLWQCKRCGEEGACVVLRAREKLVQSQQQEIENQRQQIQQLKSQSETE